MTVFVYAFRRRPRRCRSGYAGGQHPPGKADRLVLQVDERASLTPLHPEGRSVMPYGQLPDDLVEATGDPALWGLYAYIDLEAGRSGWMRTTYTALGERCGWDRSWAAKQVRKLVALGFLSVERQGRSGLIRPLARPGAGHSRATSGPLGPVPSRASASDPRSGSGSSRSHSQPQRSDRDHGPYERVVRRSFPSEGGSHAEAS